MDLFSWLPILIFIYAVATIFSPSNKKPQNRRPSNHTPYSRQRQKSSRPNWREKFEELERELFPKEIRGQIPRTSTNPRPQTSFPEYEGEGTGGTEGYGTEGWSQYGAYGTEGIGGIEGSEGQEGTMGQEGAFNRDIEKTNSIKPDFKPSVPSLKMKQQEKSISPVISQNALVQGVIWAEILGKPRAHCKMPYKPRR